MPLNIKIKTEVNYSNFIEKKTYSMESAMSIQSFDFECLLKNKTTNAFKCAMSPVQTIKHPKIKSKFRIQQHDFSQPIKLRK